MAVRGHNVKKTSNRPLLELSHSPPTDVVFGDSGPSEDVLQLCAAPRRVSDGRSTPRQALTQKLRSRDIDLRERARELVFSYHVATPAHDTKSHPNHIHAHNASPTALNIATTPFRLKDPPCLIS